MAAGALALHSAAFRCRTASINGGPPSCSSFAGRLSWGSRPGTGLDIPRGPIIAGAANGSLNSDRVPRLPPLVAMGLVRPQQVAPEGHPADLLAIKRHGLDPVRTAHDPSDPAFLVHIDAAH